MKKIYIDTSDNKKTEVCVAAGDEKACETDISEFRKSQVTLPLLEKVIENNKIHLDEIENIQVNTGPGSFTGVRVGVTIANALSFCLQRKVNNKKISELAIAEY